MNEFDRWWKRAFSGYIYGEEEADAAKAWARLGYNEGASIKRKAFKCRIPCTLTHTHTHCPECGSTEHAASNCDMGG